MKSNNNRKDKTMIPTTKEPIKRLIKNFVN